MTQATEISKTYVTIRKHRCGAWQALIVTPRGTLQAPYNYATSREGAESVALYLRHTHQWEYRKPVEEGMPADFEAALDDLARDGIQYAVGTSNVDEGVLEQTDWRG